MWHREFKYLTNGNRSSRIAAWRLITWVFSYRFWHKLKPLHMIGRDMGEPKFSVVIPYFNDGAYIDEAITSVKNQTLQDFEILLVDSGSTDPKSIAKLKELEKLSDVTIVYSKNDGPASARNLAISRSKGVYILPLDADDKIHETYLARASEHFEKNPGKTFFYSRARFFGMLDGPWNLPEFKLNEFAVQNCIFASGIFKKEMWREVGGYNPNMLDGLEDYDFWIKSVAKGYQPFRHKEELFYYRIKKNSRTARLMSGDREVKALQTLVNNNLTFFGREDILPNLYLKMHETSRALYRIERSLAWRFLFKYVFKFENSIRSIRASILGRGEMF